MSASTQDQEQIINEFFSSENVRPLLVEELGSIGRIQIDWDNRLVIAQGMRAKRFWQLDILLQSLIALKKSKEYGLH